jgi:hypothetical protein
MGTKYMLTITDAFTKYAEIMAISNKKPGIIHGGKEFIIKIASECYQKLKIKMTHTAPAHLQCNRRLEAFNETLAK